MIKAEMTYRLMADGVVWLHLGFVFFVAGGALLVFKWPRVAYFHLPAAGWGAIVEFTGWVCPLTPLENRLRSAGVETGYAGGFVDHYLLPLLYPTELTRDMQIAIGIAVVAVNGVCYARLLVRRWRHR